MAVTLGKVTEAIGLGTQRVTVGTGIVNLHFRHPAMLGARAVAIDELSDRRLSLGIVASNPDRIGSLGLTWHDPRLALRKTTAWQRQVFAGKTPPGIRTPLSVRAAAHPHRLSGYGAGDGGIRGGGELADGLMAYIAPKAPFTHLVARMQRGAPAGRSSSRRGHRFATHPDVSR